MKAILDLLLVSIILVLSLLLFVDGGIMTTVAEIKKTVTTARNMKIADSVQSYFEFALVMAVLAGAGFFVYQVLVQSTVFDVNQVLSR